MIRQHNSSAAKPPDYLPDVFSVPHKSFGVTSTTPALGDLRGFHWRGLISTPWAMLASATEIEVELDVPNDGSTFFGVTWAQDPRKDKIFIKAFPRGLDGRIGVLESTGLVELDDCLMAVNGVPVDKSRGLRAVMACIRAAKSPLSLRFARYPPPPPLLHSSSSSSSSSFSASSTSAGGVSGGTGGGIGKDGDDPELDSVLNSALLLGLGERVADIQKRNSRLVLEVDRIREAAADKRKGVERVASAAASLTATGAVLPKEALRLLSVARQDTVALCEAMARLDELLALRERAQTARRRALEHEERRVEGGMVPSGGGVGGGFEELSGERR